MMFRSLLLYYLFGSFTQSFHLYNTYILDNQDYKDCLYSLGISREWILIPYCIRYSTQGSNGENILCYSNEAHTFHQLKSKNVSSADLYSWHAPVDTINNYQRYLIGDDVSLSNHSYCNCSGETSIRI